MILNDLAAQYIAATSIAGRSPATVRAYRQRLDRFIAFHGDQPLTRKAIRAYITQLQCDGLSPISIAGYVRDLTTFFAWCVQEGELATNPSLGLTPKVPQRKPAHYRAEHIRTLLLYCDARDRAIVFALLDTGLRRAEFVSLRRDRIDWKTGRFTVVGKGNKERSGAFGPLARAAIQRYLDTRSDDHPALWYGRYGPLTADGVYQMLERRAKQAGLRADVRRLVHSARASFAKNYLKRGGNLKDLADLLGHTTLTMAGYYGQLNDDELLDQKHAIDPIAEIWKV